MPISVPSPLIEFFLLGSVDDRRQLQDSPILGDVWIAFGKTPSAFVDLLISPYMTQPAAAVAAAIEKELAKKNDETAAIEQGRADKKDRSEIAYLQGLVVARLSFREVIGVVVPKTKWWIDKWTKDIQSGADASSPVTVRPTYTHEVKRRYYDANSTTGIRKVLNFIIQTAKKSLVEKNEETLSVGQSKTQREKLPKVDLTPLDRFVALTGLILWAGDHKGQPEAASPSMDQLIKYILEKAAPDVESIVKSLADLSNKMLEDQSWKASDGEKKKALVWQVSKNRKALPALAKSVPAVKADAATTLFKVNCSDIAWAILDSGIDGGHPAFEKRTVKESRVKRAFDFRYFRKIVNLSNSKQAVRKENLDELLTLKGLLINKPDADEEQREFCAKADDHLKALAEAKQRGTVLWDIVEKFIEIDPTTNPDSSHGTHVSGIIGANKDAASRAAGTNYVPTDEDDTGFSDGMCPDISLYDFRVLGNDDDDTEFAIIAALQFIRYLNDRDNFFTIHGANLSLSIPHDVRNYACGRTPICVECERVIDSGVVVVAAAGNHGHKSFETKEGVYEGYAAFSITDPGNADGVITVGATHRNWPHTYGVSFFSSRGPTGDGRLKPDLVAPGERIRATFPGGYDRGGEWGELDGTSMAAPHVSGAAAMLMARYPELIGQPRRLKQILCDSATDLGRERTFQGHGMLDVLRAFQSI